MWARATQFVVVRYIAAGALSNAWVYVVFLVLYRLVRHPEPVPVYLCASLVALPVSFVLNRMWVFSSSAPLLPQTSRFVAVYAISVAVGATILSLLVKLLELPVPILQALAVLLLVTCSFLVHRLWTFAARPEHPVTRGDKTRD